MKISEIRKWMAEKTQNSSESHCPVMQQKIGRRRDYCDLRVGIHSITLSHCKREGSLSFCCRRSLLGKGKTEGDKIGYFLCVQIVWRSRNDIYNIVVKY
jgi:hypothetical protein